MVAANGLLLRRRAGLVTPNFKPIRPNLVISFNRKLKPALCQAVGRTKVTQNPCYQYLFSS